MLFGRLKLDPGRRRHHSPGIWKSVNPKRQGTAALHDARAAAGPHRVLDKILETLFSAALTVRVGKNFIKGGAGLIGAVRSIVAHEIFSINESARFYSEWIDWFCRTGGGFIAGRVGWGYSGAEGRWLGWGGVGGH